jgi:hypothetical protein
VISLIGKGGGRKTKSRIYLSSFNGVKESKFLSLQLINELLKETGEQMQVMCGSQRAFLLTQ